MHILHKTTKTIAAVAALGAVVWTGIPQQARAQTPAGQPAAQKEKKYKDNAEYDIYNEVSKDALAKNYAKEITDLDTWKQKYPESDFKDDRTRLYVQAYADSGQHAKAVETSSQLLDRDLDSVYDPRQVIQLLLSTSVAVQQIPNPTAEQLAIGEKAAHQLMDYNKKPQGVSDGDWAQARTQLQTAAKGSLLAMAIKPGDLAMAKTPPDCDTAAGVYAKALGDYPDRSFISYNLGRALKACAATHQDQSADLNSRALYEFIRAAVTDPSLGGSADAKKIAAYADQAYTSYHGDSEGLAQLKEQAKGAALPPAGFIIETGAQIAAKKQKEFQEKYPEVALWLGIKSQLADPTNGVQYFDGQLKDAAVPELKGTLLDGKPACRSKELLVAVPLPDATGSPTAEITLKLDAPLTGKPESGVIRWEGVPTSFTQSPFMLTMDTEKAKIKDLKTSPCTAAPARGGVKKAAPKKK